MAHSQLAIHYFNGKGRAEVARLILHAADKKFKDIRYPEEDWPKYKHIAPFGQCPLLEIDGTFYAQSLAIKSFLAREFGFHGRTNLESLKIDQVTLLVEDLTNICVAAMYTGTEEEINKNVAKTKAEVSPRFVGYFEQLLKENDTGYFCGDRITLADLAVFDVFTGMLEKCVHVESNHPRLLQNMQYIRSHSKLGPYIDSRLPTPF